MATREDSRRYLENWQDEIDSAAEYRAMAESEPDARLARVYGNLARMEEVHITFWEAKLRQAGVEVGSRRPSWRSRVLRWIGRRLGPDLVLATIAAREEADQNYYITQPETTDTRMAAQERWHAKVLKQLVLTQPRGLRGSFLGRLEGRHRAVGGNALRAAVLGANDGLCSNLSLVMGVAGAAADAQVILVTGLAGLLAGACSMALLTDRSTVLDALAREELGIEPSELGGSAGEAAASSFLLFSVGAVVPILPFLVTRGNAAVASSGAISGLALFGIGAAITLFTGRPVWRSGGRQLLLGLAAAGVTFGLGKVIGIAITG